MPIISQKTHSAAAYKILALGTPGAGGLNIEDLDYTLNLTQSPKMLNMMYKNGVFGKRYGQIDKYDIDYQILAMHSYKGFLIVQTATTLVKITVGETMTSEVLYTDDTKLKSPALLFVFNKTLYLLNKSIYLQYDGETTAVVDPYAPDIAINRKPDGSSGDLIENYNRLGAAFKNTFHGDGSSKTYVLTDQDLDATKCKATVGTTEMTEDSGFTVDRTNGKITFTTAPASGTNNVVITAYKTQQKYIDSIMGCHYMAAYGGNNNSRVFLAGNGTSTYYYSGVYDATYFPELNDATVGNTEDDITGFGLQYDVLIVFKPTEIYSVNYTYNVDTNGDKTAVFTSLPVNDDVGCDIPDTIKYIDNRLTWGNSVRGICTLCSTVILDERNVRVISRNINGGERNNGLLAEEDLKSAMAIDYGGKYCVFCPSGNVYAWDYTNAPYSTSDKVTPDEAAQACAWFLWNDMFIVTKYTNGDETYYIHPVSQIDKSIYYQHIDTSNHIATLSDSNVNDFDNAINSYYQTPLMDFKAYESLKTIKKAYFEVNGESTFYMDIKYITDDDSDGEDDPESISISRHGWSKFRWDNTWGWAVVNFAKTFARKCSIKKVLMMGIMLSNNIANRDMCISGIKLEYTVVKEVK
jgi:hypothetical protein